MPHQESDSTPRSPEFDQLVLEHSEMLYAVALRLTRNVTEAQDLTHNTIVKAFRFHDKFQPGTYIKAWLLTILRNTFINEYRRKTRRPAFVELTGAEAAPNPLPDPNIAYEPAGSRYQDIIELLDDEVVAGIDSLPEEFRIPVIMADVEDKSYKQIAETMGCPLGTVMSRLYRGRKLLRESLRDYAQSRGLGLDDRTPVESVPHPKGMI